MTNVLCSINTLSSCLFIKAFFAQKYYIVKSLYCQLYRTNYVFLIKKKPLYMILYKTVRIKLQAMALYDKKHHKYILMNKWVSRIITYSCTKLCTYTCLDVTSVAKLIVTACFNCVQGLVASNLSTATILLIRASKYPK